MKKKHIWKSLAILLLIVSMFIAGCAAQNKGSVKEPGRPDLDNSTGDGLIDKDHSYKPGTHNEPIVKNPGVSPPGTIDRKFIENGELELRSADVDKTYQALSALAISLGGRVVSYEQSVGETYKTISMHVAVPFGKLASFMEHAGESATKIETKSVKSEEVTEEYYDTKVRIESNEKLIDHYRTLLTKAQTIEETLQVQQRIDELTVQMESLKGRFQRLEYLTQESQIAITIRMETDPVIVKPEVTWKTMKWSDVGFLMKNAIHKIGIAIALGFQYFLVFLAYAAPFIALLIVIYLIVWLVRRKKRKLRARVESETKLTPPSTDISSNEERIQTSETSSE